MTLKVFVTGASGYIGSAVIRDMLSNGYQVVGLARSDTSARAVEALGADVLRGDLTELDVLRRAAREADAVAHLAYNHDFGRMAQSRDEDAAAIAALGDGLAGIGKPIVTTAATALLTDDGSIATEDMVRADDPDSPRVSEKATAALGDRGVRAMVVRLSQINGPNNHGFVQILIDIVRSKGFAAYVGDGANRWPACYRDDAARLYRLAIERGTSGHNYHAVAEQGIAMRDIVGAIGAGLDVPVKSITPEESADYYGWAAMFMQMDNPTSSALTRSELGWTPTGPTLLEELRDGDYFTAA